MIISVESPSLYWKYNVIVVVSTQNFCVCGKLGAVSENVIIDNKDSIYCAVKPVNSPFAKPNTSFSNNMELKLTVLAV